MKELIGIKVLLYTHCHSLTLTVTVTVTHISVLRLVRELKYKWFWDFYEISEQRGLLNNLPEYQDFLQENNSWLEGTALLTSRQSLPLLSLSLFSSCSLFLFHSFTIMVNRIRII